MLDPELSALNMSSHSIFPQASVKLGINFSSLHIRKLRLCSFVLVCWPESGRAGI